MNHQPNTKNTRNKEPRRAVCYMRVASADDRDSTAAIDTQREACQRKARELGATVVDIYADVGTGSAIERRPALRAMLARVKSDQYIHYVITWDHTRLARDIEIYRKIVRALMAAGVDLVIVKKPGGPGLHKAMQSLVAAMAELDTQQRREARRAKEVVS